MPLPIRLERRLEPSRSAQYLTPVASLALALTCAGALLAAVGADPMETYGAMLQGAFGSPAQWRTGHFYAVSETLVKAVPLIFTGLAVSIAFRARFWNIGAEGQLVGGGVAAAGVALFLPGLLPWLPASPWVYLPLMALAGVLAGAALGVFPALLKSGLQVNEIITTLMLNYVAILGYRQLFSVNWKDPNGFGFPGSATFPQFTWLPRFAARLHWGLAFAIVAAALVSIALARSKWGYEIRLMGESPRAARYAGVNVGRNIVLVMLVSGGLAGLAGMVEVAAISHRLQEGLAQGIGFTAIIVAWLAKLNPWGILAASILLAALQVGGDQIQIAMGLPASLGLVLQSALLFFVLGGDVFTRYRLRLVRHATSFAA